MAETFTPPTSTSYPAVFDIVRTWLGLAEFRAESATLDSLARNIAADMCQRDLAPAAYGDKRQSYHSGAFIGVDGVSVYLRFSDDSAEFVFREEEMDLVNEEERDLYVRRVPASEVLALRQSLIDYLPAAEDVVPKVELKNRTLAAEWRDRGEPDPHGDRYDCPRENLDGGHLTDDQVAFQTAMLMRGDLNHEAVLTVAKDRIRWLSRRVVALETTLAQGEAARG